MDMINDKAMGEGTHGITQNIMADCLHDVPHENGTVTFDAFPFFVCTNTLLDYGVSVELIFANLRFNITKLSAGW